MQVRTRKILLAISIIGFILLAGIIILAVIIAYLRKEVEAPVLNIPVTDRKIWDNSSEPSICDPYNRSSGTYRLNFYNSDNASSFAHTRMTIKTESDSKLLASVVVPQGTNTQALFYSYLLPKPDTYHLENFVNGVFMGSLTFRYPNPCNLSPPAPVKKEGTWVDVDVPLGSDDRS